MNTFQEESSTRKVFHDQTSSFVRQVNFSAPGKTVVPPITADTFDQHDQQNDWEDDTQHDDLNCDEREIDGEDAPSSSPEADLTARSTCDNEVSVEDVEDEEINDGMDVERATAELYEERTMHDILGLGSGERAFLAESSRSDIEQRIREIVYPTVEIMVRYQS
jgi:hypothetical protein